MSFWSSEKIKQKQPNLNLIEPYKEERVKHAAYELSLGDEAFITSSKTGKKEIIPQREQIVIEPGQFGILITEEIITIPEDTIGFISMKAGIKFRGLINVSGFHVDPGFSGYLKFSVYNAGSQNILLDLGEPVFLIWFCSLDKPTKDTYSGTHAGMKKITKDNVTDIQGEVASPSALNERLKGVEKNLNYLLNGIKIIVVSVLLAGAVSLLVNIISEHIKSPNSNGKSEEIKKISTQSVQKKSFSTTKTSEKPATPNVVK